MQTNPNPPVKRGRPHRISNEQKLAILQQWQAGTPVVELCRTHRLAANTIYRWKRRLDHGLRDQGELIPKSRLLLLQRKIDELERALGRKALEVDILKKFCELKDLRLPEGM
jgi:transposase-like protein